MRQLVNMPTISKLRFESKDSKLSEESSNSYSIDGANTAVHRYLLNTVVGSLEAAVFIQVALQHSQKRKFLVRLWPPPLPGTCDC